MTHGHLLGFDTSTPATGVCLLRGDGAAFETAVDVEALSRPPAHASELMPGVAEVLERAGVGFGELEAIAVGVGPGTFTGLRIGVATARGLALAQGLRLRPVSSLAALAAGIAERAPLALPIIDAKRGEVFAALHRNGAVEGDRMVEGDGGVEGGGAVEGGRDVDGDGGGVGKDGAGGGGRPEWEPFVATPEALVERVGEAGVAPLAAGDGSVRFRGMLEAVGIRVEPDGSPVHVVRALHICRLAAERPGVPPETVLPEYLRAPDAKPQPQ